jgi:hypothetical protein
VAALDAPSGIYNVVETEPSTKREVAHAVGAAVGRAPRVLLPGKTAKLGGATTAPLSRSQRVSNKHFREATGWVPQFPAIGAGMADVVAAMPVPPKRSLLQRLVRPAVIFLAFTAAGLGLWAVADPVGFYESFPFGRGWVAADGPYNEHLIRDFGTLHLALAVLYGAVALWPERRWVRVAALAALIDAVPHLAYHAFNLDPYGTGDAVATIVGLAAGVLLPAVMILGSAEVPSASGGADSPTVRRSWTLSGSP